MKNPTTVPRIVTIVLQSLCLAGVCSFAHAEGVSFSGQLDVVLEDNGNATYSGTPLGTNFVGSIDDETFEGFIVDAIGTTRTEVSCCIAAGGLDVANYSLLYSDTAA